MKHFKCSCEHCGGRIEYPVEAVGLSSECPHCGRQTDLTLPPPPETSTASRRGWLGLIVAGAILLLGVLSVVAAFVIVNRLARRTGQP